MTATQDKCTGYLSLIPSKTYLITVGSASKQIKCDGTQATSWGGYVLPPRGLVGSVKYVLQPQKRKKHFLTQGCVFGGMRLRQRLCWRGASLAPKEPLHAKLSSQSHSGSIWGAIAE